MYDLKIYFVRHPDRHRYGIANRHLKAATVCTFNIAVSVLNIR